MIKKIVNKQSLEEYKKYSIKNDLNYWLSKLPSERIAAVDYLRKQYHGNTIRLQRTVRIIQRTQS
jgi:hypothetical protein